MYFLTTGAIRKTAMKVPFEYAGFAGSTIKLRLYSPARREGLSRARRAQTHTRGPGARTRLKIKKYVYKDGRRSKGLARIENKRKKTIRLT